MYSEYKIIVFFTRLVVMLYYCNNGSDLHAPSTDNMGNSYCNLRLIGIFQQVGAKHSKLKLYIIMRAKYVYPYPDAYSEIFYRREN